MFGEKDAQALKARRLTVGKYLLPRFCGMRAFPSSPAKGIPWHSCGLPCSWSHPTGCRQTWLTFSLLPAAGCQPSGLSPTDPRHKWHSLPACSWFLQVGRCQQGLPLPPAPAANQGTAHSQTPRRNKAGKSKQARGMPRCRQASC